MEAGDERWEGGRGRGEMGEGDTNGPGRASVGGGEDWGMSGYAWWWWWLGCGGLSLVPIIGMDRLRISFGSVRGCARGRERERVCVCVCVCMRVSVYVCDWVVLYYTLPLPLGVWGSLGQEKRHYNRQPRPW